MDHPVGHSGNARRPQAAVRFGDMHPPHRRRHVAFRGQQPAAQRRQLMVHISIERHHALAVDPARPAIGPDRSPSPGQVRRIGYRFQQLAHRRALLVLSQPLPSPNASGRAASPSPGAGPAAEPKHGGRASRLGLGRPLRRHPQPSQAIRPPAHVLAAGQRALPRLQHYYEPSDSSQSIGLPFPNGL